MVAEIDAFRNAVRTTLRRHPFNVDAWVVLPNHTHCVWTLLPGDQDFPARWQLIKALFSRAVPHPAHESASLLRKREAGIWQRRYWEHTIRDDQDYAAHIDYIHFNPVKHGLVVRPADWPYSTFSRSVSRGMYPMDWAMEGAALGEAGEAL